MPWGGMEGVYRAVIAVQNWMDLESSLLELNDSAITVAKNFICLPFNLFIQVFYIFIVFRHWILYNYTNIYTQFKGVFTISLDFLVFKIVLRMDE